MKTKYYGIQSAIADLIDCASETTDTSATTIRCWLNDLLDSADKSGFKVNFDYDQDRAVRICQNALRR